MTSQESQELVHSVGQCLPAQSDRPPRVKRPRVIQSCAFCYNRKLKCDKQYPCSHCLRRGRGDVCHPPEVEIRGRVVGGPNELSGRRTLSPAELVSANAGLHRRVASQKRRIQQLENELNERHARYQSAGRASNSEPDDGSTTFGDEENAKQPRTGDVLDTDLWVQEEEPETTERLLWPGPSEPMQSDVAVDQWRQVIPWRQSDYLVGFHLKHLHWIHCVFHAPTFLDWHAQWILRMQDDATHSNPSELALYFAVISTALFHVDHDVAVQSGFSSDDTRSLPRDWCALSLRGIEIGLQHKPNLLLLQAMCILPMIGHTLGHSRRLRLLLHAGLLLAQDLELHLLEDEDYKAEPQKPGTVAREVGKRIWNCLVISEAMTPAVLRGPVLLYQHCPSDNVPSNIDDIDLSDFRKSSCKELPDPTTVSHMLAMRRLAQILHDYNTTVFRAHSLHRKHAAILEVDTRLIRVLDFCPALSPEPSYSAYRGRLENQFDYLPWARFTWEWKIASYRMKIHSTFLGLGYVDVKYRQSEQTCLSSALTLLRLRQRTDVPAMWLRAWRVTLDMAFAGVVIAKALSSTTNYQERGSLVESLQQVQTLLAFCAPSDLPAHRAARHLLGLLQDHYKHEYSTVLAPPSQVPPAEGHNPFDVLVSGETWDWTSWVEAFETSPTQLLSSNESGFNDFMRGI